MGETEDLISMLSPGEQLRMKREERGFAIEDVAQELLLSVKQVEAIENNDHESLPGPTYIVGYWKSYATLLELDLDEAIGTYKSQLEDSSGSIVLDPHHQRAHGHQEKSRKKSAVVFFLLSGVFLAAIWYWQNPDDNPFIQWAGNQADKPLNTLNSSLDSTTDSAGGEDSSQIVFLDEEESTIALPEPNFSENFNAENAGTQEVETDGNSLDGAPVQDQQPAAQATEDTQVDQEQVQVSVVEGAEQVAVVTETAVDEIEEQVITESSVLEETDQSTTESSSIDGEPAETESEETLAAVAQETESTVDENTEEQATEPPSGNAPDSAAVAVKFTVTADSWLDVRDASGEKLIYRTVSVGEDLEVSGQPPYSVFIGSATGVEVTYLGEIVEFEPHSSGLFARFELPPPDQE